MFRPTMEAVCTDRGKEVPTNWKDFDIRDILDEWSGKEVPYKEFSEKYTDKSKPESRLVYLLSGTLTLCFETIEKLEKEIKARDEAQSQLDALSTKK